MLHITSKPMTYSPNWHQELLTIHGQALTRSHPF